MPDTIKPQVSVLMSVHNGESHLADSIESILNQTFTDFEFLIIDDGSTDGTNRIIKEFQSRDSRIKLIYHAENKGLTKSLNEGLKIAMGDYIARQDSDDISYPRRLQSAVEKLDSHDDIVLVTSSFEVIDLNGTKIQDYSHESELDLMRWHMLFYNHISAHSGITFRKSIILRYLGYDEDFTYAQDYDLWLRILDKHKIYSIPEVLLSLRLHNESISSSKQGQQEYFANLAKKNALNRLIGNLIFDANTVEALGTFWLKRLPTDCSSNEIHKNLCTIYEAFIDQHHPNPIVRKKIRRRCSLRFFEAINRTADLVEKMKLFYYCIRWSGKIVFVNTVGGLNQVRLMGLYKPKGKQDE